MRVGFAFACLCALVAAPALGAAKVRPAAGTPAAAVSLENRRRVSLVSFEIVMPAKGTTPETVVGKLEKPLASGASASFPLVGGKGCAYEARWAFEDMKDASEINLCNDARIVLVD